MGLVIGSGGVEGSVSGALSRLDVALGLGLGIQFSLGLVKSLFGDSQVFRHFLVADLVGVSLKGLHISFKSCDCCGR